jgi:hypothetical protein
MIGSNYAGALALGEHQITWTATDFTGNTSTAIQTVIVEDTTAAQFGS